MPAEQIYAELMHRKRGLRERKRLSLLCDPQAGGRIILRRGVPWKMENGRTWVKSLILGYQRDLNGHREKSNPVPAKADHVTRGSNKQRKRGWFRQTGGGGRLD